MGDRAGRTDLRRFEMYTQGSFFFLYPVIHGTAALSFATAAVDGWLRVAGLVGIGVHLLASIAFSARALAETPDRHRYDVAYAGLTLVVLGLLISGHDPAALNEVGVGAFSSVPMVLGGALATLGLTIRWSRVAAMGATAVGLVVVACAMRGVGVAGLVGIAVFGVAVAAGFSPMGSLTWWMLDVVRTLARSRATHARLAVAEERLRFSRDLHDVYGRTLSAIALKSELAAELARRGDGRAVSEMTAVRDLAQTSLADVRRIVSGYRQIGPDTELAGARSLLRSAGARLHVDGLEESLARLDQQGRTAAAWVLREATTNVLRHSVASVVRVEGRVEGELVRLVVENDGVSRERGPIEEGTGLIGLSERLESLGGWLRVDAREGRFAVTATLPVASKDASEPAGQTDEVGPAPGERTTEEARR